MASASRLSRAPACTFYPSGSSLTVTWGSPFTKVAETIGYGLELPGATFATRRDQPTLRVKPTHTGKQS